MTSPSTIADSLASLPPLLALHIAGALSALVLGGFILWGRKGTGTHRWMGQLWVACMGTAALTSVFIGGGQLPNIAGVSPIHALTLLVLWQLPRGVMHARRGDIVAHRKTMRSMYIGGCLVAGMFTLLPGRFLGHLLWNQALGLAA
jgi:uncharacterized membrane protein